MGKQKLTNSLNLPRAFVRAVEYSDHVSQGSDFGVTSLVQPPQLRKLMKEHRDEIVEDVSSRVWLLLGTACHHVLERAAKESEKRKETDLYEQRYQLGIELANKIWKVACIVDCVEDGILYDYKVTSAFAVKDGPKDEWIQQLNFSNAILAANDVEIKGLKIVAILRDWSANQASRDPGYPPSPVIQLDIPMWDVKGAYSALRFAVIEHTHDEPRECTDDERWASPEKWAVMKKGLKKAKKLHLNEEAAQMNVEALGNGYYVEHRPATYRRCETYCAVQKWCKQHRGENNG